MIEIIVLIFLVRHIGKLAERKGQKTSKWKILTVVGWIVFELIGFMVGIMIFGVNNLISIALVGFMFAVTSYFLIKSRLENMPDIDINDEFY